MGWVGAAWRARPERLRYTAHPGGDPAGIGREVRADSIPVFSRLSRPFRPHGFDDRVIPARWAGLVRRGWRGLRGWDSRRTPAGIRRESGVRWLRSRFKCSGVYRGPSSRMVLMIV